MASPLYISIGLHYYTCAGEFEPQRINAPAVQDALGTFVEHGMLIKLDKPDEYGATYKSTEGLRVWCKALCCVNWPVRVWQIEPPREDAGA